MSINHKLAKTVKKRKLSVSNKDACLIRQTAISKVLIKGWTLREIIESLTEQGFVNRLGKPYSRSTISNDIAALCEKWREESYKNVNEYKCKIWAELQAIKKEGWNNKDYHLVLSVIKQERELMGLDEQQRIGIDVKDLPQIIYMRKDEINYNFISNDDVQKNNKKSSELFSSASSGSILIESDY